MHNETYVRMFNVTNNKTSPIKLKFRLRNRMFPITINLQRVSCRTYFPHLPAVTIILDFNDNNPLLFLFFLYVFLSFIVYVFLRNILLSWTYLKFFSEWNHTLCIHKLLLSLNIMFVCLLRSIV